MKKVAKSTVYYILLGIGLALMVFAGWKYADIKNSEKAAELKETEAAVEDLSFMDNLEGNYSFTLTAGDEVSYSTAVVRMIATNMDQVTRMTVYGPMHYSFEVTEGKNLSSEEMGTGVASYKSELDKTLLHFEKENVVCELSK